MEESRRALENYVASLTIEAQDRAAMLEALEQSELFYDAQYGEARSVVSVSATTARSFAYRLACCEFELL